MEAIREADLEVCGKRKKLVGEQEREVRKAQGWRSSTVLIKVIEKERVRELCCAGLWVGGAWCSVRRLVVVPVRKKEAGWLRVVDRVDERFGEVEARVAKMEAGLGPGLQKIDTLQSDRLAALEESVAEMFKTNIKVMREGMRQLLADELERLVGIERTVVIPGGPQRGRGFR